MVNYTLPSGHTPVKLNQICTRHFPEMTDRQHFAPLVDHTLKITAGLVTCRGFVLAKPIRQTLQHCHVLRLLNVGNGGILIPSEKEQGEAGHSER
jgi:hypothetical protein